jgi:hypothetical protein
MEVPEGCDYRQAPVKIVWRQHQEKTYEKWDVWAACKMGYNNL